MPYKDPVARKLTANGGRIDLNPSVPLDVAHDPADEVALWSKETLRILPGHPFSRFAYGVAYLRRGVLRTSPLMSIMPIFFGDLTYNPLQGPAPKNGPAADRHGPTVPPVRNRRTSAATCRHAPPALRRTRPCHPFKQGRCGIDTSSSILPCL